MKVTQKFAIIIISFLISLSACLPFEENDLDPNSDLNRLVNILTFANINRILTTKQYFIVEFEVNPDSAVLPSDLVSIIPSAELSPINSTRNIFTTPNSKQFFRIVSNQFEVLIEGKDLYNFKLYNQDGEVYTLVGEFNLDIFEFSNPGNTPPLNVSEGISINITSIRRLNTSRGVPIVSLFGSKSIGTFEGRSFRWGLGSLWGDFAFEKLFNQYPTLFTTRDGINYETVVFQEFPLEFQFGSVQINNILDVTNAIQIGDELVFLAERTELLNGSLQDLKTYVFYVSLRNPQNYRFREIQTIVPGINTSNRYKTLFQLGSGIAYQERDYEVPNELFWKLELGDFTNPSQNFDIIVPGGSLFEQSSRPFEVYRGDLIVNNSSANLIAYIKASDFSATPVNTFIPTNVISDGTSIVGRPSGDSYALSANPEGIVYTIANNTNRTVDIGFLSSNLPNFTIPIDFPFVRSLEYPSIIPEFPPGNYTTRQDNDYQFIELTWTDSFGNPTTVTVRSKGSDIQSLPQIPILSNADGTLMNIDNSCDISGDRLGGLWCLQRDNPGRFHSIRMNGSGVWESWNRSLILGRLPER